MSKHRLNINMLGEFYIGNDKNSFVCSKSKGTSTSLLLAYIIANKDVNITTNKLSDVLWPDSNGTPSNGALRTLTYRARKFMEQFFPGEDVPTIMHMNNSYFWNPELELNLDTNHFEKYYSLASKEEDPHKQYTLFSKCFDFYKGEFLPLFAKEKWVVFRNNYYSSLYLKCIQQMCAYLESQGNYEAIIDLCNISIELAPQPQTVLHKQKLKAFLGMDATQNALDYYYSITNLYSQKYGLDITDSFQDIYLEILQKLPNKFESINNLEDHLKLADNNDESFYCSFDIFKNIYQINKRSLRRSKSRYYLILLTLKDTHSSSLLTVDLRDEMELLSSVIRKRLRKNDVYTKSSICQFSLIIAVPNEHSRDIVLNRIANGYHSKSQHGNIQLSIDTRQLD